MISLMATTTTCALCGYELHDGRCRICDGTTPMPQPERPSLADLFAAAEDREEAIRHMWSADKFAARLADTFPSLWDHPAISDSQILDHQWYFRCDGLDVAVTWYGYPRHYWLFQCWDSETEIACDTSEEYLSQPDGALLVFMGAAVIAAMTNENDMKEAA